MKNKTTLSQATYMMDMGCESDVWALYGTATNHPNFDDGDKIFVSTPKQFDEKTNELITASGRCYKILSYLDRDKVVNQIKEDIKQGGYEVH